MERLYRVSGLRKRRGQLPRGITQSHLIFCCRVAIRFKPYAIVARSKVSVSLREMFLFGINYQIDSQIIIGSYS